LSTLYRSFCCTLYDRHSIIAIIVIALSFLRKLRLWKKDFRIHVRVLQVAVVNGHTAVEKELRKFLKVRKANCNTGVDVLNYSSKTTHFGVWGIEFWLRSEIGYELWGVPPCLPNIYTFYFFIVLFLFSGSLYSYIIYELGRKYRFSS